MDEPPPSPVGRDLADISMEHEIGRGACSVVRFGRSCATMEPFAIKVVTFGTAANDERNAEASFDVELRLLTLLAGHRHVPRLFGHHRGHKHGYLVLEYIFFPLLEHWLQEHGPLPSAGTVAILRQLVEALLYLTERGVAHRDIKPANIMVSPDTYALKLIDFGLGCVLEDGEATTDDHFCGTPVYMAPEALQCDHPLTERAYAIVAAEVWSVGVCVWECLLGRCPFSEAESRHELRHMHRRVHAMLHETLRPAVPLLETAAPTPRTPHAPHTPHTGALLFILQDMLSPTPEARPSVRALRNQVDFMFPVSPPSSASPRTVSTASPRTAPTASPRAGGSPRSAGGGSPRAQAYARARTRSLSSAASLVGSSGTIKPVILTAAELQQRLAAAAAVTH